MDKLRFALSLALKTIGLAFLGLVAAKAVAGLKAGDSQQELGGRLAWIRGFLYAGILTLVVMGARGVGIETSSGIHALASETNVHEMQFDKAYANALRAVELRPDVFAYWNRLSTAKFVLGQFKSVLKDEPVFRALSNGNLDDDMILRLAYCHYFLGDYHQVFPLTRELLQNNRDAAAPALLEATTYTAEKKYAQAQRRFLDVLQIFPTHQAAVEGLAQVHYLMGNTGAALEVLDDTTKFSFSPQARQRFVDLKAFYGQ